MADRWVLLVIAVVVCALSACSSDRSATIPPLACPAGQEVLHTGTASQQSPTAEGVMRGLVATIGLPEASSFTPTSTNPDRVFWTHIDDSGRAVAQVVVHRDAGGQWSGTSAAVCEHPGMAG